VTFGSDKGLAHLESPYGVAETLTRLETVIQSKGLSIFTRIDHTAAAAHVGLTMPPAVVVLFGSPKAGTPLMIAAPTLAIDLPLKALVWKDGAGAVWLSYNTPDYLKQRHAVPDDLIHFIAGIGPLCEEVVRKT
jgi:uncharacterized protein (DUF302 family)